MSKLEKTVLVAAAIIVALVGWAAYESPAEPLCTPNGAGCGAPPGMAQQ